MEYQKRGVGVGDVGRITPDGGFDFMFNIDSSLASLVNPLTLPRNFETIPPVEIRSDPYFLPGESLLSDHVKQTKDTPITYTFLAAEGAVLQVPEGATIFEAEDINVFYDIAVRHAQDWYEYMLAKRSRDVPNGSLYLVTGSIKTRSWGIGTLYGRPTETDYLEFTSGDQSSRQPYGWKKAGPIMTKVGPTSTDVVIADGEEPNQCLFFRGYRITLGGKLWKDLRKRVTSGCVCGSGGRHEKRGRCDRSLSRHRQGHEIKNPGYVEHRREDRHVLQGKDNRKGRTGRGSMKSS
jgi:hypothetical protein